MTASDKSLEFLSHSSTYKPLDDFLLSIGIKNRPKSTSLSTMSVEGDGIIFSFIERPDYVERYGHQPLSDGELILDRIDFNREGSMPLPFELEYNLDFDLASKLLGEALQSKDPEMIVPKPWMPRFHYKIFFIVLHFDKNSMRIKHAVITHPSLGNRKHFRI
ncbi:MAG: hypothetical protein JNM24_05460 [Bdellovibrionaceae bacterium]|nr:hypothetical protein [Pseudobdellovibrionaceae bacterium]